MDYNHEARKILITGQSGTGKTTYWLARLKVWPARWKFVFDPDRETARKLGWMVAEASNQLEWAAIHGRPVCYDPTRQFPGDRPGGFDFFCGWIMAFVQARDAADPERGLVNGNKLVAVDELQNYTEQGRGGLPHSFRVMLDAGRREEVDLLLISQALNEVNHVVRRQLTEIVTFQHTDSLPLDWLEGEGFNRETVSGLPAPGGYLWMNRRTRQIERGGKVHAPNRTRKRNLSAIATGAKVVRDSV